MTNGRMVSDAIRTAVGLGLWALVAAAGAFAQQETPIKAGDPLFVDVYRRPELSSTVQVDANGNIPVPYVGNVNVAGATEKEAASRISNSLLTILKTPRVTVSRSAPHVAASPRTAEMKTQVINLNNASAQVLSNALQGMSTQGGSIGFDVSTNSLIVTDTPATIQNIQTAISQLDQLQSQLTQVRIEAKVAEVEQGAMKALGIRWFFKGDEATGGFYPPAAQQIGPNSQTDPLANERVGGGSSSATGTTLDRRFVNDPAFDRRLNVPVQIPTPGQMFFGLLTQQVDIGAMLDALVQDKKGELLASPWTLAVNHKQAEIKMTDEYPYTESSQTFGGTNFTVKFMDLGIKMLVTPHVYKDTGGPYVQLDLKPEVSFSNGMSNGVPVRSVRSSNTIANVRDNQTLVIGGIVLQDEHNTVQRVPGLGKLPLIGNLFKRKERAHTRNELMIFVTPTIYQAPENITWDRMINLTGAGKQDLAPIPKQGPPATPGKE